MESTVQQELLLQRLERVFDAVPPFPPPPTPVQEVTGSGLVGQIEGPVIGK